MLENVGYGDYKGTGVSEEILASMENLVERSITVSSACRDLANGTTTELRRGLLLYPDAGVSNLYTEFDAAAVIAGKEATVVVLAEPIVDISTGNLTVKAYEAGVFKKNKLIDASGYTLTHFDAAAQLKCQRIVIRERSN
jgi:hypothetical protein